MTPRASPGLTLTNFGFSAAATAVAAVPPAAAVATTVDVAKAAAPIALRSSLLVLEDPFSLDLWKTLIQYERELSFPNFLRANDDLLTQLYLIEFHLLAFLSYCVRMAKVFFLSTYQLKLIKFLLCRCIKNDKQSKI
jgi:hypothetical protein